MAEWFEDQGFLKGLDKPAVPPPSGGTATGDWASDTNFLKSLDGPQIPEEKTSTLSKVGTAASVGLREGVAGASKMYEIPFRFAGAPEEAMPSHYIEPSEEEKQKAGELGVGYQLLRGAASLPGAALKYAPLMAIPGGPAVAAGAFAGEKALEDLSRGKTPSALELAEEAAIGGIFKGIEPLGRAAKAAILGGTFSTQAFAETYAQTKDVSASLKAGIAPAIMGAGMGAMSRGREKPVPTTGFEATTGLTDIATQQGELPVGTKNLPAVLPPPERGVVPSGPVNLGRFDVPPAPGELPYVRGLPENIRAGDRGVWKKNPKTGEFYQDLGRGAAVEPSITPDWVKEGRDWPPPQYPPDIYRPRASTEATGGPTEATKPEIPPTPALTPSEAGKPSEARPPTDRQMASVRDNAGKVGGLSIDLIKRWTGLGTKRANAILEDLVNKGEIEGGDPGDPYPWRLKGVPKPETGPDRGFIKGTSKDKLSREFNEVIQKRFPDDENSRALHNGIADLYFDIEKGQPGRRIFTDAGRVGEGSNLDVTKEPSTYPDFISSGLTREGGKIDKITREEALRSLGKGIRGDKLGKKEGEIWAKAKKESREAIEEMKIQAAQDGEEYERLQKEYPGTVEGWLKNEEAKNNLTKHLDDEIMGLKEELRETFQDDEISGAVEKATKALAAKGITPDARRIEQEIRSLLTPKPPDVEGLKYDGVTDLSSIGEPDQHTFTITEPGAESSFSTSDLSKENLIANRDRVIEKFKKGAPSPTRKGETLLPGMKVGTEFGTKGTEAPTLEGTPLGEAARKAEIEKAQPSMFEVPKPGEAKPVPADLKALVEAKDADGIMRQGGQMKWGDKGFTLASELAEGTLKIDDPDLLKKAGFSEAVKGRLPAVMADGELLIGSGTHGSIPPERYSEAKDVRIGWVDTEGNFIENKPSPASVEPTPAQEADPLRSFVEGKGVDFDSLTAKQKERWKNEFEKQDKKPGEKPEARTGEAPKEPLNRESVNQFANERLKELRNAPETEIVDSIDDIPEHIQNQMEENARNNIKGVYDPMSKKIYLVRNMMGSEADVISTIEHEAVGHYAMEAYLGREADPFFNGVFMKFGRAGLKDIAEERGFDLNTREGRINAAKEKVAQLAETGENPGLLKQFYSWIREQIRKVFPDMKLSDAEIQTKIMKGREFLANGEARAQDARYESLRRSVRDAGIAPDRPFRAAEFSLLRKAQEVGKAGYEEEVKTKVEGVKDAWDWLKKTIAPTYGVDVKTMDMMMKMTGNREWGSAWVDKETMKAYGELEKMSPEARIDLIDKIQTHKIDELPDNLRAYANLQRIIDDMAIGKANPILAKMDKPSQIQYLKDHVRNFWKVVPRGLEDEIDRKGFEGLSRRPLEGTRSSLHHQYWTLKEGMENGGVPFTTNLMEIARLNYNDTMKLVTAHEMWNGLGEMGNRQFIRFGEAIPEGFKPLDDRIANKYFPPKEAGRWVVEENAGRLLENYLSRDLVRENPALKGIMGIKNITTALELGFSAFHASFEFFEAAASQMGLGMRKIINQGQIVEGIKDLITAPMAGYDLYKVGKNVERLFRDPDTFIKSTGGEKFLKQFPEARQMIGDLFWGGGSVRMNESYRIKMMNVFKENLESKNYIGAALRSIPALSEFMMKPLFENYIPAIKRAVFFKEFSNELVARGADLSSGKITRPELARNVWSFVENRFGEMNFDNLWWNRTMKSGLQMGVRSVTWKLGNIRSYGNAVAGQSAELLAAMKEGRAPKLTQEMAWMWGLGALTAAMAGITQYMFTGKSPENWKDLVYPQIDNAGGRLSLPTYARDFFSATHAPVKYVTASLAGWFGRFTDVLNNKDFYGTEIHDPNENMIMQRVDDLVHMVPLPFSIQSFTRMRAEGQPPVRQITGFLGATKAPYWIERSEAEQKASYLKAAHLPQGGREPADFERGRLLKKYATQYQAAALKGEPTDEIMRDLHTDIAKGNLHMADLLRFRQRIQREPLVQSVQNLPFKDILQVWNVANGDEKKKLYPVLNRKFYGLRAPEDRAVYLQKMRQIQEEMKNG